MFQEDKHSHGVPYLGNLHKQIDSIGGVSSPWSSSIRGRFLLPPVGNSGVLGMYYFIYLTHHMFSDEGEAICWLCIKKKGVTARGRLMPASKYIHIHNGGLDASIESLMI